MAWWAIAAAAVSALSSAAAQRGAEKRQNQLSDAMRQYGLVKAGEQEAATRKYIDTIAPEARAEQLSSAKADAQRSIEQTVAEAVKAQPAGPGYGGKVSADYAASREAGLQDTSARIKRAIEQLAVGASTGKMAVNDDLRLARAATELGAASSAARNVGDQYLAAIQTVRPNSGLSILSKLSGALASYGAGGGTFGSTAAAGTANVGNLAGTTGLRYPSGPAVGLRL